MSMYSCDKLFSAFTPRNRENINKKRLCYLCSVSLQRKVPVGVTCCIILIIVAVCSGDIEGSPGAECTELREGKGCPWCWVYLQEMVGVPVLGVPVLGVLLLAVPSGAAGWEQHFAPSCLSCVCSISVLLNPTLRHTHKRYKISEQSPSLDENREQQGIKQMV